MPKIIERMDAINLVDVLVYIPAYGVFMAFFFLGMRERHASLATLGFRVTIIAVLGDYAENACLMNLILTRYGLAVVHTVALGNRHQMARPGCGRSGGGDRICEICRRAALESSWRR